MPDFSPQEITQRLQAWRDGQPDALDELLPLVYDELHRQAHRYLRRERPGHTLQTTALIHEAYLKLLDVKDVAWHDRTHFFALAASLMRRALIDYARVKQRDKRGGGADHLPLEESLLIAASGGSVDLLALDEALTRLAALHAQQARIVELRYFAGLSIEETAAAMRISTPTVTRAWRVAKAWLYQELSK